MSTKIWTAWRLPASRLNEFLDVVRPQMFANALAEIERLMKIAEQDAVNQRFSKSYGDGKGLREGVTRCEVERYIRCEMVLDLLKKLDDKDCTALSVNCGLNVWAYRQRWYVIPWGLPSFYETLTVPEWAEDYAYWNNTDPPEGMTWDRWNRRGDVWDRAALKHWDAHRLVFYVVDLSRNGTSTGPILRHFMKPEAPATDAAPGAGGA